MAIVSIIRRWNLREGIAVRAISRRLGISRNTVRRYLRFNVVEPVYANRQSLSKLDAYASKLSGWLKDEASKPRKRRRTLKQIHADLSELGFSGSYDRVAAFARSWRLEQREQLRTASKGTYIPLYFEPGEAFQFDWSEDWAMIGGMRTKLHVAHFKLSHSRAFFLRAYLLQTHEMLFDAHYHAFVAWEGIPRRGIYDNMKTAVDRVGQGKERTINPRFAAMASHYLFDTNFCNVASGWEKGQIEKNVQDSRRRIWQNLPAFESIEALNDWLAKQCVLLWRQTRHPEQDRTIWEAWSSERPYLMPVGQAFDGFVEHTKRVSPTCLVNFDRNRYSVPASFANRPVSLRVYASRLIFVAEGRIIAEHLRHLNRHHGRGQTIYDWRHYLAVLQRKPGAVRNGAPLRELPAGFKQLQTLLLKRVGGDCEMVDILALVLLHDEQAVLAAVELALEAGAPSKQAVLNFLSRLLEHSPMRPVAAPQALSLTVEPQANVARYDRITEQEASYAM